jgi:ribosomal protein S18 acetylase RimI-like enzyme
MMKEELSYKKLELPEDPDWDAVEKLFLRMYEKMEEQGLMLPLGDDGAVKWLRTTKNTSGKYGLLILAKEGEKAIGFAHGLVKFLPDYLGGFSVGSITHIYVDEHSRRSGIGKALVNQLEVWFREKKVHSVELQVISGNPVGKEFWKSLGYQEELCQHRKCAISDEC